jgi:hypothetical protein
MPRIAAAEQRSLPVGLGPLAGASEDVSVYRHFVDQALK